jgi:hypothetical protein
MLADLQFRSHAVSGVYSASADEIPFENALLSGSFSMAIPRTVDGYHFY